MRIEFQTPHQYFFIHEQIKHLLILWSKDQHRELYVVEEKGDSLLLNYPGETYRDLLFDQLGDIFFQRLETDSDSFRAALAATFTYNDQLFGAYYPAEQPQTAPIRELYFFEISDQELREIPDHEYERVVKTFFQTFPEYMTDR